MPKFRNVSGERLSILGRPRDPNAMVVEPDQVVTVAGTVESDDGDCYVIADKDDQRAWPKALWKLEAAPAAKEGGSK